MGNVSSKPLTGPTSTPSSPTKHTAAFSTGAAIPTTASSTAPAVTRSSFTIDLSSREKKVQQHQRSQSYSVRPFFRSQHSDSGNSTGKSQNELVSDADHSTTTSVITTTIITSDTTAATVTAIATTPPKEVSEGQQQSAAMPSLTATSMVLDKPLPVSPLVSASASVSVKEEATAVSMHPHSPPTPPSKDTTIADLKNVEATHDSSRGSSSVIIASALAAAPSSPSLSSDQKNSSSPRMSARIVSLTQQSVHSQSSLSDKSISSTSTSSGSRSSNNSTHTFTTRTTVTGATTTESLGQLSLQRFPTGESEYKNSIIDSGKRLLSRSKAGGEQSRKPALDAPIKTSRTTSMVSTSSARSSSGSSSGFKFVKPNLSFKPLLYSLGNDSKNQQHLYQHHNNSSTSSASPNASHHRQQHQQALDPFANSPFPSILLSIQLPQSLLDKYVMDVEGFRHGKGIWGIGQYSWTITVLARANGKRYVIKRVSKSLLPPSAYYHYPTTAHRLCTCPACKSSRDQLLLAGQLDQEELKNIQEVLVIQNNGRRKELPQLPSSSSQQNQDQLQQQQQQQQRRPLSASSVSKEKKNALNLYSNHNASMPNHQRQVLTSSPDVTPQDTPVNSRPSTPSQSPLRQQSSLPFSEEKIHNKSQSHCYTGSTAQSLSISATIQSAQSRQHKDLDPMVSRARSKTFAQPPEQLNHYTQMTNIRPDSARMPPTSTSSSKSKKGKPTIRRSASTPNLSQTVTGLEVLEDDPARVEQLKQISQSSRNDWLPHGTKSPWQATDLHSTTFTPLQPTADITTTKEDGGKAMCQKTMNESLSNHSEHTQMVMEKKVSPFDTNDGEFKQLEPVAPRSPASPLTFVPPPHALPMELVLLQTYNDSDHLPEHHEWTQDQEYWYYVTKAHGVKRRKLKKVSSWWLDMGSLGGALLSGSSSSNEPIATGPIYNMGQAPGTTSPLISSPLSSEAALPMTDSSTTANGGSRHTTKESISSITSQESSGTTAISFNTFKRQSSPRNSHMGKYYYVNWDEYTSL